MYGLALVYAHKTRGGAHLRAGCTMAVSTSAMKPPKMPQAAAVPTIGLRHDFEESSRTHNRHEENDSGDFVRHMIQTLRDAESAAELAAIGDTLTQHVDSEQDRKRKQIMNQMAFLRSERDAALGMKQTFEVEMQRLKRQLEVIQTEYKLVDKARVKSLQAQLQAVTTEKQTWRERADKLEDVCETLKLVNSLQRSMSKEGEIRQEYTAKVQEMKSALDKQSQQLEILSFELEKTIQERNTAIMERNKACEQLQTEQTKSERQSRILEVLRRKVLIGSGNSSSSEHVV